MHHTAVGACTATPAPSMTLIQTAKPNGVDPMAWLTEMVERIDRPRCARCPC
jgi:IS66 C-terminal element